MGFDIGTRIGKGKGEREQGMLWRGSAAPLCSADVEVTLQELYWEVQGLADSLPSALKSSNLLKHWFPSCHLSSGVPGSCSKPEVKVECRAGTWGKGAVTEPRMKEKQNPAEKWELLARICLGNGGHSSPVRDFSALQNMLLNPHRWMGNEGRAGRCSWIQAGEEIQLWMLCGDLRDTNLCSTAAYEALKL